MTITIKSKTTKDEIIKLLSKLKKSKLKKSLRNVYGKFRIEGNAVTIQKELRNEWD